MKKILFVALAAVGLAACVQNEELAVSHDGKAISFDNVYVENATKAAIDGSYTAAKGNLDHFNVWATIGNNGQSTNIFENLAVTKNGGAWTYDAALTQYWIPGNYYEFVGVVDGNVTVTADACKMPVSIATNLSEQKDVLYATANRTYNNGDVVTPVHLQFEHLLAKAKFTVKNGISTEMSGYDYVVENITITNADNAAVYTIADGEWAATSTYEADFGVVTKSAKTEGAVADRLGFGVSAESNWEHLVLPQANKELNIVVDYKLYKDAVCVGNYTGTEMVAVVDLVAGKAYNFILVLGNPGAPITFTADVTDWVEENAPVYDGTTVYVASTEELVAAIADPEVTAVVLNEDIELGSAITRADDAAATIANKDFVLDGNGKTLTFKSSRAIDIVAAANLVKNVTIKNLTIKHTGSYFERGINFNNTNGTLVIDNVKFEGEKYPSYAINFPSSSDGAKVTIKNSHIVGLIALNVWGSDMKIDVIDTYLSNHDTTEVEDYATVKLNNDGSNIADGTVVNIKGGKVVAYNQNGEPSNAIYNATSTGDINVSESTEVIGNSFVQVAVVAYANTDNVYGMASIKDAIAKCIKTNGLCVRVTRDVVIEEPLTIANGESVVVELCGHTISAVDNATAGYALITNKGNLNVVGPGKLAVEATNNRGWNAYSSVISNSVGGNLVVDGGVVIEHLGGTDMAYGIDVLTNGKGTSAVATIKNATVKSPYRAVRQFLNGIEATNELHVEAGAVLEGANKSIFFQDPSKNANTGKLVVAEGAQLKGDVYLFVTAGSTEWPVEVSIASSALVGESAVVTGNVPVGYDVVEENGVWTVIKNTVAATTADLQTALAEGKDVVLANNLTITPEEMSTAPYGNKMALSQKGGVFNGNGKAISVTANGDNYVLMTNGGTIKNLDIDRGFRGVVLMSPTQDVYVDNVKVGVNDEVCYTINTAEGDGTHSLYVSNSVLNGWCSIGTAVKDVTFTNCTFGQGTYYTNVYGRLVKPYVNAVFDGCDFCNKCYLDLSAFEGTKVIVKNCTVNGVKITAENWASLVAPEATCEDGQISVELKNGSYLTAENVVDYIVFE